MQRQPQIPWRPSFGRGCAEAPVPARSRLGIEVALPERNGAQRAREALDEGASIEEIYRAAVAETRRTYAGAGETAKSL